MSKTPLMLRYVVVVVLIGMIFCQGEIKQHKAKRKAKEKTLTQNGLLTCAGIVQANRLETALKGEMTIDKSAFSSIALGSINTNKISIKTLTTSKIIAKNEQNTLYINSLLKVKGKLIYEDGPEPNKTSSTASSSGTSFVQLSGVTINNYPQWKQVETGISLQDINSQLNSFIISKLLHREKPLKFETEKTLPLLKEQHKDLNHLRVEMTFHFDSILWNGNKAYIKVNNDLYWLDNHKWNTPITSMDDCENDNMWQTQIKMIIPFRYIKGNSALFTFGVVVAEKSDVVSGLLSKCKIAVSKLQDRTIIYYDNIALSIK